MMYIVFEGPGYCGKTTQLRLLKELFSIRGVDHTVVREPGGTEMGDKIRTLLLDPIGDLALTDVFLFVAARAEVLTKIVKPALQKGSIVIGDRGIVSSLVYQGHLQGLLIDGVLLANQLLFDQGLPFPDLILHFDVSPETSLVRYYGETNREQDKFDNGELEPLIRLREGYALCAKHPLLVDRWININAEGSVSEVHQRVVTALTFYIKGLA